MYFLQQAFPISIAAAVFLLLIGVGVDVVSAKIDCPDPDDAPLGTKCKACDKKNTPFQANCNLRSTITCTYVDHNNKVRSCFPPGDDVNDENPEPTFTLTQAQCNNDYDDKYVYDATITYEICNDNEKSFDPRPDETFLTYSTSRTGGDNGNKASIEPSDWDDQLKKSPKDDSCREHTIRRTFRPCEDDYRTMTVVVDGYINDTSSPNYCRCFVREFVKSKIINTNYNTDRPTPSPVPPTTDPNPGSPNAFIATIQSTTFSPYPKMEGFVHVDRKPDGGDLILNYGLSNGPINCLDCKIGIFEGMSCNKFSNAFFDDDDTHNPWFVPKDGNGGARYVTNRVGDAASIVFVFNGRGLKQHACKFVALYASRMEYGPKAHNRNNAIACGQLVPVGESESYCD